MLFNAVVLVLSGLPLLASSAPVSESRPIDYDAIIVGGGPAGLSALSGLARVRRNTLLIDSGVYRNDKTRHMHDVLGFDGVTPAYFRAAAREQLSHYKTVSATNGTVTKVSPMANNTYFEVTSESADGRSRVLTARKVVLATGLRDILPSTPGLDANWGQGIYWCPWCDGHEHADQELGLIAGLEDIPGLVREVLTLNRNITAFVNGTDTAETRAATELKSPRWQEYLRLHRVTIDNRIISSIERLANGTTGHEDPRLPTAPELDRFRVHFASGPPVERSAFLTSFKSKQASTVGEEMGVTLYGGRLAADQSKGLATNIFGVYAIGDANSDNVTNVPHALFSGKRTAVYLHVQLERENAARELANLPAGNNVTKRSIDVEARSVWNIMNGPSDDMLHAGEFDQPSIRRDQLIPQ
ncbi:hypothetical protein RJ55_05270 [Drechmeria coniospora]|nr:hypothetical protein RJ55_05270 [Drechmeria coniospora]